MQSAVKRIYKTWEQNKQRIYLVLILLRFVSQIQRGFLNDRCVLGKNL